MFLMLPLSCLFFSLIGMIIGYFYYKRKNLNIKSGILTGGFIGSIFGICILEIIFHTEF